MNNYSDTSHKVAKDELRSFIERIEKLDAERKDILEQKREVMNEASGRGYHIKTIRKIIALRGQDKTELAEEEAVFVLYREALGL